MICEQLMIKLGANRECFPASTPAGARWAGGSRAEREEETGANGQTPTFAPPVRIPRARTLQSRPHSSVQGRNVN